MSTGAVLSWALLCHLAGDYLLQSDWMANEKTRRWLPALVHAALYTLPFLLLTRSPWALAVIGGTHAVIDRYRLVRYLIWVKNLAGPRSARVPWPQARGNSGFSPAVPAGLALALMVVCDNTVHLLVNAAVLTLAGTR